MLFHICTVVDDHGEMRADAQHFAAAAIETKSDEKEISRAIKVLRSVLIDFLFPAGLSEKASLVVFQRQT